MRIYTILIASIIILSHVEIRGQSETPTQSYEFIIDNFTLPGGTLANNVNSIVEGPNGFLWFGTHGGLIRYDGYEFVTYTNEIGDTIVPTTSLTFNYVEHLYWDQLDKLWVSTYGGGLYRFDPVEETFQHFAHDPTDSTSISNGRVMYAQEDANGTLWVSTESGLNRFDRRTKTFKHYYPFGRDNEIDNTFRNIYVDKQDVLWISAGNGPFQANGGLVRYNPDTDDFTVYMYGPNQPAGVREVLEDSQGNFWVGNVLGLNKMDRANGTFQLMPISDKAPYAPTTGEKPFPIGFSLLEDTKGALWVGSIGQSNTDSYVLRYDPVTSTVSLLPIETSAWDLTESSDGTIWVAGASMSGQVVRVKPQAKTYDLLGGDFYQDEWKKQRHMHKLNGLLPSDLVHKAPINIGFDNKTGLLWSKHVVSRGNGIEHAITCLSSYDRESKEVNFYLLPDIDISYDPDLPANIWLVSGLVVTDEGTVWCSFGGKNCGIIAFDPKTGTYDHLTHDPNDSNSLSSNNVVDVFKDSKQYIWVSTYENGLNRINSSTKEITRYDLTFENNNISDQLNFPISVTEDMDGYIWACGKVSRDDIYVLVKIDPQTDVITTYPTTGLTANTPIHSMDIIPSINNLVFTVSENRGMGYFDPENLQFDFYNTRLGNFPIDVTRKVIVDDNNGIWFSTRDNLFVYETLGSKNPIIIRSTVNYGSNPRLGAKAPDGHIFFLNRNHGWYEIDPSIVNNIGDSDSTQISLTDLYVLGEKQTPNEHETIDDPIWKEDEINLKHDAENFSLRFTDFDFQNRNLTYQYRLYPYETTWRKTTNEPLVNYFKVPSGDYNFQMRSANNTDNQISIDINILPPWWRTWWAYLGYVLLGGLSIGYFVKYQRERAIQLERERIKDRELEQAKKLEVAYDKLKESEREAQIEASLERVRAASMAMHKSEDLSAVTMILFEQLKTLGLDFYQSWISIYDLEQQLSKMWLSPLEGIIAETFYAEVPLSGTPIAEAVIDKWKAKTDFAYQSYYGEAANAYMTMATEWTGISYFQEFSVKNPLKSLHITDAFHQFGNLAVATEKELGVTEKELLQRFSKVFDQTYTRFLDLQKAEAQAKEAQIEAALERVRSRSMAMQNSSESMDLVLVLFDQIKEVGIAIESSWITLVDKDSSSLEFWVRHGDQVADAYIIDANDHPNIQATLQAHKDHVDIIHIPNPKHDFIATAKQLFGFEVQDRPDKTVFHLLQIRHRYGYIGLGTWEESTDQETILCRRFANVFEQTYTRFLDLKKSEAQAKAIRDERDRLDATLSELKSTQAQLIQAEKMASLGELTAGIAHEIQNPLNFVNNFSEVSGELIDEALEEMDTDPDEAKDILNDLKLNLEKINHHGKRADSIVKGMLQHSRAGTGEKVPTDINALCDEYVRLAYHGLRAKDKSFNADYELDLDNNIGKINVVPQDISRVILNIITNAFQATFEKSREIEDTACAPKVTCTTLSEDDQVIITISDNGQGIPEDIKEKIFQPFFTTKPTGQGTGLGLSMAYDIIKAHGGELTVDSEEGKGTTFSIQIPK